ncbi:MAG TPA: type II toxin-antitoxin system Phd/YefM family antitoxin [Microvirga sp.]|jgi:prevent-host-death family protein
MAEHDEVWTVQDARAHFSDVIDAALKGKPQRVSRRGKDTVVVISEEEWKRIAQPKPTLSFGEHLARFPLSAEEWDEIAPRRHKPRKTAFSDD